MLIRYNNVPNNSYNSKIIVSPEPVSRKGNECCLNFKFIYYYYIYKIIICFKFFAIRLFPKSTTNSVDPAYEYYY